MAFLPIDASHNSIRLQRPVQAESARSLIARGGGLHAGSSALLANNLAVSINGQIYTPISSRGRLTRGGCMDGNNDADTWRASTRQTKPFLSPLSLPSIHRPISIPLSSVCLASTKACTSARIKLNHN